MELFERYLHAVRSFLPKAQQDDVIRELSEDLRSQVEEREAELGRGLNEAEQKEILRHLGHPILLASRYSPQRQLIGPVTYPIYWFILKLSLGLALAVHVVAAVVSVATGRPLGEAIAWLATLPVGPLMMVFAWVTLAFAVLDRNLARLPFVANWNPDSLRSAPVHAAASRRCLIAEIAAGTFFLAWLAAAPWFQWLVFGPAWTMVALAPVWNDLYVPLLLLAGAGLSVSWIKLLYPIGPTLRLAARMIGHLATIAMLIVLARAEALIVPTAAGSGDADWFAAMSDNAMRMAFVVAAIVIAIEVVRDGIKLAHHARGIGHFSPRQG